MIKAILFPAVVAVRGAIRGAVRELSREFCGGELRELEHERDEARRSQIMSAGAERAAQIDAAFARGQLHARFALEEKVVALAEKFLKRGARR